MDASSNDRPAASSSAGGERYTFGDEAAIRKIFNQRTLAVCGGLLPQHLRAGMMVLDCGCGSGGLTVQLAELASPGQVWGIDAEPSAISQAKTMATQRHAKNVTFQEADVYALPFADQTFDAVFSHALMSHLREPVRALTEAKRVLKKGGVVGVVENDAEAYVGAPAESPIARWWELFLRVLEHNGGNRRAGRYLTGALLEAGFIGVVGHAGAEAFDTLERRRIGAAGAAATVRRPDFVETLVSQGWASGEEMRELAEALPVWAERPDAFFAVLKCSAVGWVPDLDQLADVPSRGNVRAPAS